MDGVQTSGAAAATAAGHFNGQAKIIAGIAAGAPLRQTLELLAGIIQEAVPGAMVCIGLTEADGTRLAIGAAPALPEEFIAAINGLTIGPEMGTCGTAAHAGRLVITEDVATDPRWEPWRETALRHGLRACWSTPIFSRQWNVLGTFAMYFRVPGTPAASDLEVIGVAAHLAAIAIENTRAQEACEQSDGKFRAVFDHAFSALLILDDAQTIVDANPAAGRLMGVTIAELLGKHINIFSDPVLPKDLPDWSSAWARFIADGEFSGERVIRHATGSDRLAYYHAKANYQPGEHLCAMLDVTRLRRSERAVAQTEQLYRTLVETTNTGYCVVDPARGVVDANAEYLRLAGANALDEISGRFSGEWTAPYDQERQGKEFARCVAGEALRDVEIDYVNGEGKITPVEINARSVETEGGTLVLAMVRDITTRRLSQQELYAVHAELETRVQSRTAELARANAQIRQRAIRQEAVAAFGRKAIMGGALDALFQEATEQVASTLDVAMSCVMEHAGTDTEEFILRGCMGWPDAPLGQRASWAGRRSMAAEVLESRRALIVEDMSVVEPGYRAVFEGSPLRLFSGMAVLISGEDHPYGVLMAHSLNRRQFSQDDSYFLQSMANILAAAMERHHSEQALQAAQQAAVRANSAKSDFLSRMSHELRTPLNAILGFGQLLEIERMTSRQQESVDQIVRAGRHLLNLVNEVLDISRIESGQLALSPEPVLITNLLREALDLIRPLADARRIVMTMRPEVANSPVHVLADRQRFRQVLLNLLSNAVKYNREGGTVEISGGRSAGGERWRLEVRDSGVGIPPGKLSRLFTPFERLGAEYTEVEGNGMGLALSKRLVDSQRGAIGAESEENIGSMFWVEMPMAVEPAPALDLPVAILEGIFGENLVLREDPPEAPMPAPSVPPKEVAKQTVLHIEDNESNRRLIEMLLARRPSLRLVSAARGGEGLELAREHHPALILLDMHLPDTTGEDVLSHLRAEDGTRETPVVVVSADATAARSQKLRAAGANDYLTKPFNVVQFLKILDDYLFKVK